MISSGRLSDRKRVYVNCVRFEIGMGDKKDLKELVYEKHSAICKKCKRCL